MSQYDFNDLAAREVFLNPGETGCGGNAEVFGTLLGSCVAITLWHPGRRVGSISHFVLPALPTARQPDGKYGNCAFDIQKLDMIRRGVTLNQCQAKIFGGGRMFSNSEVQDIGAKNIQMARKLLQEAGLPVMAENVGGEGYRRLYFDTETGEVWIKFDWLDSDQEDKIL